MRRLKPFDFAAAFVVLGAFVLSSILFYGQKTGEETLLSAQTEGGTFLYPLDEDRTLDLEGPLGITRVEISDESARIISSPCRNQTCVRFSPLSRPGQFAACVPNRVFIRIENPREDVDAFSY